jgi:hypothetical protein
MRDASIPRKLLEERVDQPVDGTAIARPLITATN